MNRMGQKTVPFFRFITYAYDDVRYITEFTLKILINMNMTFSSQSALLSTSV